MLMCTLAQANKPRLELSSQNGVDQVNRERAEVNGRI
jgi:hypothetical protein